MLINDAASSSSASKSEEHDGGDWLEGSDREDGTSASQSMAERDIGKVQRKMYDEGYREGIAAGKETAIQAGFDSGFAKGSPLGRQLGQLRGTIHALQTLLAAERQRPATTDAQQHLPTSFDVLRSSVEDLRRRAYILRLSNIAEPDWEAIEHEREHGGDIGETQRESSAERTAREAIIPSLQVEADRLSSEFNVLCASSQQGNGGNML